MESPSVLTRGRNKAGNASLHHPLRINVAKRKKKGEGSQRKASPACDATYVDANQRQAGEKGFIPPLSGVTDPLARAKKAAGLDAGYDADYRDSSGRAPGDMGFVPPLVMLGEDGVIPPVQDNQSRSCHQGAICFEKGGIGLAGVVVFAQRQRRRTVPEVYNVTDAIPVV